MKRVKLLGGVVLLLVVFAGWVFCSLPSPRTEGFVFTTDTAISTEAHFIRHKSVTDLTEVFGLGPGLLPYFSSDFVYAVPPNLSAHEEIR